MFIENSGWLGMMSPSSTTIILTWCRPDAWRKHLTCWHCGWGVNHRVFPVPQLRMHANTFTLKLRQTPSLSCCQAYQLQPDERYLFSYKPWCATDVFQFRLLSQKSTRNLPILMFHWSSFPFNRNTVNMNHGTCRCRSSVNETGSCWVISG